jgi:hypothetical protein
MEMCSEPSHKNQEANTGFPVELTPQTGAGHYCHFLLFPFFVLKDTLDKKKPNIAGGGRMCT